MPECPGDEERPARFIPLNKPLAKCEVWPHPLPVLPPDEKPKPIETFYTPLIDEEHTQAMLVRNLPHLCRLMHGPYRITLNGEPLTMAEREKADATT